MKPTQIIWQGASKPHHGYKSEVECETICNCCAQPIARGVTMKEIETPTMSRHGDIFRFGTQVICPACAWMFNIGKGKPGNFISTPEKTEFAVISQDSVVLDKRPWSEILLDIFKLPPETPVTGVMTTDVKPRLWPWARTVTVGDFGLYVHHGDYDFSGFVYFDLAKCIGLISEMNKILDIGFSKRSMYFSLLSDNKNMKKDIKKTILFESLLEKERSQNYFLPALISSGLKKEQGDVIYSGPLLI